MNLAEFLRRIGRLVALVVLAFSGYFFVLYLLRWEWNRALVAGILFLAAEIFLVTELALARMRSLSRQVEQSRDSEEIRALAAQLRRNRPPAKGPFAWLSPPSDRTYVFVPVLLAAGVVLSALAFVLERVSRITATPVAEHELARGLASMALPQTGLAPTGHLPGATRDERRRPAKGNRITWIIAALVVILALAVAGLRVVLVTRSEPADPSAALVVDLVVERKRLSQSDESVALSLWGICQIRIPEEAALLSLRSDPEDPARIRMIVSPAPARFDTREFTGCLEDAVIQRVLADVISVDTVPIGTVSIGSAASGDAQPANAEAGIVKVYPTSSAPV